MIETANTAMQPPSRAPLRGTYWGAGREVQSLIAQMRERDEPLLGDPLLGFSEILTAVEAMGAQLQAPTHDREAMRDAALRLAAMAIRFATEV